MYSNIPTFWVVQYLTVYSNSNTLWIPPPPPTTSYYASEDFYSCYMFYATNHGMSKHNSSLSLPPWYPSCHHFSDNTFNIGLFSIACWNFHLCRTKPAPSASTLSTLWEWSTGCWPFRQTSFWQSPWWCSFLWWRTLRLCSIQWRKNSAPPH